MESFEDRAGSGRTAAAFVAARRAARSLPDYPGEIPQTLASAYAIQDAAMALRSDAIGGWKVGRIFPPLSETYGSDRLAGPIFARTIVAGDSQTAVSMPVFAEGFAAAEAEWLLRLGAAPDPDKRSYTLKEAAALIDAVHVGIEIASSPLGAINRLGPAVTISDFGNNHGLVIGAAVAEADYSDWRVTLSIDGVAAGTGSGAELPGGPIGAAVFLLELCAARRVALKAGDWISSGAITGVHEVASGARVEACFGEGYKVACTIAAATAEQA